MLLRNSLIFYQAAGQHKSDKAYKAWVHDDGIINGPIAGLIPNRNYS